MEKSEIIRVNGLDIDQIRKFYDPISDYICRHAGISLGIKEMVHELSEQPISICEAIKRISAVTDYIVFVGTNKHFINLLINSPASPIWPASSFCLIKFH